MAGSHDAIFLDNFYKINKQSFLFLFLSVQRMAQNESMNPMTRCIISIGEKLCEHRYVCTNIKMKTYHRFSNHHWIKTDHWFVRDAVIREIQWLVRLHSENENDGIMLDTMNKLNDISFREQMINHLTPKIYDSDFLNKLDTSMHLIGFTNGVFDLKAQRFREGQATDYVTKTVGYPWIDYTETETLGYQENKKLESNEYLLKFIQLVLTDPNPKPNEHVHFWKYSNNVKKIMGMLMGDYVTTIPWHRQYYTNSLTKSLNLNPRFADMQGLRLLIIEPMVKSEGTKDIVFKTNFDSEIMVKPMHRDPYKFKPMFKIIQLFDNSLDSFRSLDLSDAWDVCPDTKFCRMLLWRAIKNISVL